MNWIVGKAVKNLACDSWFAMGGHADAPTEPARAKKIRESRPPCQVDDWDRKFLGYGVLAFIMLIKVAS